MFGVTITTKSMKTGAKGSVVISQTLSSPLLQPIHKKLDEANKEVILWVSFVTKEEFPKEVIISAYVIIPTALNRVGSVLFTMKSSSSIPGFEKLLFVISEPARLLDIYIAEPSGLTVILNGFVIFERVPTTVVVFTSVTSHTSTKFSPGTEATRKVVSFPKASSWNSLAFRTSMLPKGSVGKSASTAMFSRPKDRSNTKVLLTSPSAPKIQRI